MKNKKKLRRSKKRNYGGPMDSASTIFPAVLTGVLAGKYMYDSRINNLTNSTNSTLDRKISIEDKLKEVIISYGFAGLPTFFATAVGISLIKKKIRFG
jgi:hypothetical protein